MSEKNWIWGEKTESEAVWLIDAIIAICLDLVTCLLVTPNPPFHLACSDTCIYHQVQVQYKRGKSWNPHKSQLNCRVDGTWMMCGDSTLFVVRYWLHVIKLCVIFCTEDRRVKSEHHISSFTAVWKITPFLWSVAISILVSDIHTVFQKKRDHIFDDKLN